MMVVSQPIGVFDSGIGGLTIYRALRTALPHENFLYLGDTARLPYGTKSKTTVEAYTVRAVRALQERGCKFVVVACNTASALALSAVQRMLPSVPCCGVIMPNAEAAMKSSKNKHITVLATEGTVNSDAYGDALRQLDATVQIQMLACNLLVALTEEGWCTGPEARAVVARYLALLKPGYDTLVLACTHFPMLLPVFQALCPSTVTLVDGASVTAEAVRKNLKLMNLENRQVESGSDQFLVSDSPERFSRLGALFLGRDISAFVHKIDF